MAVNRTLMQARLASISVSANMAEAAVASNDAVEFARYVHAIKHDLAWLEKHLETNK